MKVKNKLDNTLTWWYTIHKGVDDTKLNEISKEELKLLHEQGRIGICVVCGRYEEVEYKFPYHNVIKCSERKKTNKKASHKFSQYDFIKKGTKWAS